MFQVGVTVMALTEVTKDEVALCQHLIGQAIYLSIDGDTSWRGALDNLMELFREREANLNEFWNTEGDSWERRNAYEFAVTYSQALKKWQATWGWVNTSRTTGNPLTFVEAAEIVADLPEEEPDYYE